MSELSPRQRAWVEVSPTAIEANCRLLRRQLAPGCQLMAVVKADGYGHGAVTVAKAALSSGATSLGVATLQEGLELRDAGIEAPVLILHGTADTLILHAHAQQLASLRTDAELRIFEGYGHDLAWHDVAEEAVLDFIAGQLGKETP